MFYDDVQYLQLPLPEDILQLKHMGDICRAKRVIRLRMEDANITDALRKRLGLEMSILERIPSAYPYDHDQAVSILETELRGFSARELNEWRDLGWVDWICLDGKVRYHESFLSTLIKVRPELEGRVIHAERLAYKKMNFAALDEIIGEMRDHGGAARRWHMRHELTIKPEYVREGERVLVHLPLPVEYDCVRAFRLMDAGPSVLKIADPMAEQRTIAFEKILQLHDKFHVEYSFEVHMPYRTLDPEGAKAGVPEDIREYLLPQPPHIVSTPLVMATAQEIGGNENNPLKLARRIYDFLTQRAIYSYVRSYFTYPCLPELMLTSMKGDCGVFALAFIALCRCLGIPARWQSGLYCAPHDVGCHDWAQFYCEPWGWLPVDVSYGNAAFHAGSTLRHEFYFGNLDPFRLPSARAFQASFDPPKRFLRSDPYDNQNGEVEYESGGLLCGQFTEQCRMLDWEVIPL